MHRLPKSFAPLPDRQAPEFRDVEKSKVPHLRHGAPNHFSPEVQTEHGKRQIVVKVADLLGGVGVVQKESEQ